MIGACLDHSSSDVAGMSIRIKQSVHLKYSIKDPKQIEFLDQQSRHHQDRL